MAFPLAPTYQRFQVVDFPIHFGEDEMTALIPPSRESNKLIAVIKPFKIEAIIAYKNLLLSTNKRALCKLLCKNNNYSKAPLCVLFGNRSIAERKSKNRKICKCRYGC